VIYVPQPTGPKLKEQYTVRNLDGFTTGQVIIPSMLCYHMQGSYDFATNSCVNSLVKDVNGNVDAAELFVTVQKPLRRRANRYR